MITVPSLIEDPLEDEVQGKLFLRGTCSGLRALAWPRWFSNIWE